MSLTTSEKIELVISRYNSEELCELLEITPEQLLDVFSEELEEKWDKFKDIELDIEEGMGWDSEEGC